MIQIAKPVIGEAEKKAVLEVLDSGQLAQGLRVKQFEENFAAYTGTACAVATNNGTTALHAALLAAGIKKDDEVVTTPFSFAATANSILFCGAKPVFADIDAATFNISPEKIEEKITTKTKAVMIVHLFGLPCEMNAIMDVCKDHDLTLIEDACQAHGAEYKGKKVGGFGDAGAFSFYATKNMTTGEGGMITTNNEKIAEQARLLRNHGSKVKYYHEVLGYNYRMTDIAAAIGIEQLKKLDEMNNKRVENARALSKGLAGIKGLTLPSVPAGMKHVFHLYTMRVTREYGLARDALAQKLFEKGIATGIFYPLPIPGQAAYKHIGGKVPNAEAAAKEVLSLPVHPGLTKQDLEHITTTLKSLKP